jgi:hypothetical protein
MSILPEIELSDAELEQASGAFHPHFGFGHFGWGFGGNFLPFGYGFGGYVSPFAVVQPQVAVVPVQQTVVETVPVAETATTSVAC